MNNYSFSLFSLQYYGGEFVDAWTVMDCAQMCVSGCQCAKNYHYNKNYECVEAKDCRKHNYYFSR